ncbi:hypothetical protein SAMN05660337_1470 [Maridesulfovibrio ferrireducens]|uniref:Lipoprotein n=1 Tax=Maridesulfovibrio ferrireducens TaxID=246191 RepID=A0A1G9FB47_9BACT|nr:hypothetical protein [Maridesulfovibrio ferrireducens]SDK85607.1 hypothetical protein SAMN05660337_1470 [Maridesulfovibrio ferrireducens]
MRPLILIFLLLFAGCTSYQNPGLDPSVNQGERFAKDRKECTDRAKKATGSAPGNQLRFLKTYEQEQKEYTRENRAYESCMSGRGWIKK